MAGMRINWILARIVVMLAAVLTSVQIGAAGFGGRYHANVLGGTLNLVLVQTGDKISGRLDGIKGYVYTLKGEVKPEGMVGTARTGQGSVYFAGKWTAQGLQIDFAEAGVKGQPNLPQVQQILFANGAAAARVSQPAVTAGAPLPNLKQCNDTHSACLSQCGGQWKCIEASCDRPYKQCTAGRRAPGARSGDHDQVNGIMRDQNRMHIQNMDCMRDSRLC